MGEYFFGTGNVQVSETIGKRLDKIAKKHGATFVWVRMPDGYRYWFAGPNRGAPFDDAMARAVIEDAERAGLWTDGRPTRKE